ncbi:MAG TPA: 2-oxoacid:acceptor oxidoreductase family protein [Myxococcota bacterium]|nr:2-oxoacid:acceptor oxidoreductase family protein [Myxococcota bacterium]HRY96523.1 2-oxoacid:acceptor oxidoreductase family protein [Myxococcota bacterium]
MSRTEIKIGGFGGQGVILAGMIIGRAAALHDDKDATLTQSFGPEARGGACSAQVVVSTERNLYPCVTAPDVLVVMSQPAYEQYVGGIRPDALVLYESSLVEPNGLPAGCRSFGIPATSFAEELGRRMVLNIVMLGFFAALCDVVSEGAIRQALAASVPKGTERLNLDAFTRGLDYGRALRAKGG